MDRSGLFIDAGYLLAAGGQLCLGTDKRRQIVCIHSTLHDALQTFVSRHSGLPTLRTYWYDAGIQGQPTIEHSEVARLRNLKLRLGRLVNGRQKGVDSLIVRDLMTLARERAIAAAYLLSGDEDLREGVVAAQDLGVQVVLLGIPAFRSNQSYTLIAEADEHVVLGHDFWKPHFGRTAIETAAPQLPFEETVELPLIEPVGLPASVARELMPSQAPNADDPIEIGAAYCDWWLEHERTSGQPGRIEIVVDQLPVLPKDIDAPLLRWAEGALGSLRGREQERRAVRNGFVRRAQREGSAAQPGPSAEQ